MKNISITARRTAGFSLVELVVVVVIVALLIIGVFGRGFLGKSSASGVNEIQNIATVLNVVSGSKPYGAAGTNLVPVLIAAKAVPSDWTQSGATVTNNAGGSVSLVSNGPGMTLTSGGYSQAVCLQLAQSVARQGVGTTSINGGASVSGQVPGATASTQCVDGDTNSLSWTTTN